jgi:DNA-binding MurR/RpiR family transcriptional regulator
VQATRVIIVKIKRFTKFKNVAFASQGLTQGTTQGKALTLFVIDKIAVEYKTMTSTNRKIAHYFQSAPHDALFDSLAVFSAKCGVSEATVVRFAHSLGFSGYADLRRCLRDELLRETTGETTEVPDDAETNPLIEEAEKSYERVRQTYAQLDPDLFDNVCKLLMEADSVLIVGYMDAFGVAAQALHLLDRLRSNVFLSRLLFETNEINRHINEKATILFFSFEPHYKFTYQLIERAHIRGSNIVLITDAQMNPLVPFAQYVLPVKTHRDPQSDFSDISAPIHLVQAIVRHISARYESQIEAYRAVSLHRFEEFLD